MSREQNRGGSGFAPPSASVTARENTAQPRLDPLSRKGLTFSFHPNLGSEPTPAFSLKPESVGRTTAVPLLSGAS